jgi:hypothetical protein
MEKSVCIRELAGWMLDENEYRPATYDRGKQVRTQQHCFFGEETLLSATPPRVADFLDDALVLEFNRPLLIKSSQCQN